MANGEPGPGRMAIRLNQVRSCPGDTGAGTQSARAGAAPGRLAAETGAKRSEATAGGSGARLDPAELEAMTGDGCSQSGPARMNVTLDIPAGQWVAVVGRNGSGKSTLLRLIAGLLPCQGGVLEVAGIRASADRLEEIRRRVGIVFANPDNQFVGLTVADDIAFGLENLCLAPEEIEIRLRHYAQVMEIEHLLDRHPAYLSGGQKQRAAMAAVLALEPEIILFDEAASMLDERAKRGWLGYMRRMRESGKATLVSVTHDPEEVLAADRAVVLAEGRVAADLAPAELLRSEPLMAACRLRPPYALQVSRALRRRGVDVGECLTGKELTDALWRLRSIMSLAVGKGRT